MSIFCGLFAFVSLFFFFFKQKTAYELRSSDCSSDVCSSDLLLKARVGNLLAGAGEMTGADDPYIFSTDIRHDPLAGDVTHVARLGPVEAAILRFRNDAVRNRVLGLAFNRRRQGKLRILIPLAEQDDVADPEPALGQRAGLVEHDGV